MKTFGVLALLITGLAVVASANPGAPTPEIDPGSILSVSALLGSALIMLRRRK